jgi:hypothetical protein
MPGHPGGPGRPAGSRNRASLAADALLDGEAEELTRKCIDLAKAGDTTALRLCMERIAPVRKGRPVNVDLPPISKQLPRGEKRHRGKVRRSDSGGGRSSRRNGHAKFEAATGVHDEPRACVRARCLAAAGTGQEGGGVIQRSRVSPPPRSTSLGGAVLSMGLFF